MKKTLENKIVKLESEGLKLSYDSNTETSYIGKKKLNKQNLRSSLIYDKIKKRMKDLSDDEIIRVFIEYSTRNKYIDEKLIEKQKKELDKERERQEKELEKQLKKQEKEREKQDKELEKQKKKDKEQAEIKARLDESNMEDWEKYMIHDEKGFIDKYQKRNVYNFFKHKDEFVGKFKYNSFSGIETFDSKLIEPHVIGTLSLISEQYLQNTNESWIQSVTNVICHENEYNPIVTALNMLPKWDGTKRVETYLIDYIGAEDCKLTRNITIKYFYALFERLFRPGCRFDHMLVAYDETHGTGKSTILITLLEALMEFAGNSFEDSGIIALNDLGFDKDTVQCLNKAWIAYVDELAKFLKEEPEEVKKFITLTTDNARLSYAKLNKNFPRHCVFYGSTNTKAFIKDNTDEYERRFWVVDCEGQRHESKTWWDKKLPLDTKLQVLAEAYQFWKDNQVFEYNELDDEDIEYLKIVQRRHMTVSADDILSSKLMTILDFEYSKQIFDNYYEWSNEAKSKWEAYKRGENKLSIGLENDFFYQNMLKNELKNDKKSTKNEQKMIKKIPILWVKQFIQEELGRMISDTNYINKLINFKWQKNWNTSYDNDSNTLVKGCFVRFVI